MANDKQSSLAIYLRLLKYVKPLWFFFLISVIGNMLFAASQPALAHLMKPFMEALESGAETSVYHVPLLAVAIAAVRGLGFFLGGYFIAVVAQEVVNRLRCDMFDKLLEFPSQYYDSINSGHLISRITYNVTMVTDAASKAITILVREGLTVIALLGYLFWSNWKLTLVFLAIAPLLGLTMSFVGRRMRKLSHRIQSAMGDVTHVASEAINGFREMRSYGGEAYEKQRFYRASEQNRKQSLKVERTSGVFTPLMQLLVAMALAVVMLLVLMWRTDSGVPELMAYIVAAGLIPKPIRQLTSVYNRIQKGVAGAATIFEHIDQPSETDTGTKQVSRVAGKIEISKLSFRYADEEKAVLSDINLTVEPGETIAIVGRSGSGKSTLVSLIPRFYHHDQGRLLIDGVDVQDYTLKNLRQNIALVTQQVTLFNDTVANNIAYGELASAPSEKIVAAAKSAHAHEFIARLPEGYDTLIGEDGTLLSGGQRQRLAIARAILKDAPILILDEATSALDTESERFIQQALEEVMKNRTTLVIAHRLSTIENADRILVMDNGRIVEQGTHQQLIARQGAYAALHRMQFREQPTHA